jgi:hypothetical protein
VAVEKPLPRLFRFPLALALILFPLAGAHAVSLTNIQTVFLILMENVSWPDIVNGTNAPYINNVLLPQSSCASNMFIVPATFGVRIPSLKTENGVSSCGGRVVMRMSGRFCGYFTSGRSPLTNGSEIVSAASVVAARPPTSPPRPIKPASRKNLRRFSAPFVEWLCSGWQKI